VIKPALKSHNISLLTYDQADPFVFGDSIQIQQVLINVLNNAIDALSQHQSSVRTISITLAEKEDLAILSIKDNGGESKKT